MLILVNVGTVPQAPFAVLTHPFSASAHEALAQSYWNSGARPLAANELAIAADLSPVLGAQSSAQAERETAQITYWQGIAATHPDYRDAYIQLAFLTYARGNLAETNTYLQQAAALDPNGQAVNAFQKFITKERER
jgi:tetratricopeptide (TPR) repeat protein